jgi:hypothetical protein
LISIEFAHRDTMATMGVKKAAKQSAKATLAEVTKEMEKPRVASSARKHSHAFDSVSRFSVRRVVENNVEKGTVDLQPPIIVNKTQLPESVHKKTDSRTSSTHHLREGFLTDFWDYSLGHALLSETSKQEQNPS